MTTRSSKPVFTPADVTTVALLNIYMDTLNVPRVDDDGQRLDFLGRVHRLCDRYADTLQPPATTSAEEEAR